MTRHLVRCMKRLIKTHSDEIQEETWDKTHQEYTQRQEAVPTAASVPRATTTEPSETHEERHEETSRDTTGTQPWPLHQQAHCFQRIKLAKPVRGMKRPLRVSIYLMDLDGIFGQILYLVRSLMGKMLGKVYVSNQWPSGIQGLTYFSDFSASSSSWAMFVNFTSERCTCTRNRCIFRWPHTTVPNAVLEVRKRTSASSVSCKCSHKSFKRGWL